MNLEIRVTSEKKGSNPGGCCQIQEYPHSSPWTAYLKHCNSSSIKQETTTFRYVHQPFYEAITCQILTELGLHIPEFFVLLNKKAKTESDGRFYSDKTREINFSSERDVKCEIKSGMPYYFVTRFIERPKTEDVSAAEEIIGRESIYLNLLQVSDIKGKKQNYVITEEIFEDDSEINTRPVVFYLDLGCNFVNAVNGSLQFHGSHFKPLQKKDLKKALRNLEKHSIVDMKGSRAISLTELVESPRFMEIPVLNPRCRVRLDRFLSEYEIEEIIARLASGVQTQLHKLRDSPYIRANRNH
ncbi:MAG: hypothetical protein PHF67_01690 [Candidatus Nanoarchaeia archaeon]|nr:hypothetical protein [Candidatus Nanoarchaeia archaeon]